jgi:hypothetical protein
MHKGAITYAYAYAYAMISYAYAQPPGSGDRGGVYSVFLFIFSVRGVWAPKGVVLIREKATSPPERFTKNTKTNSEYPSPGHQKYRRRYKYRNTFPDENYQPKINLTNNVVYAIIGLTKPED